MNFDQAFDRLMGVEDGYVNNPRDPGGETKWGISKRSYPAEDIKTLTKDRAKAIFKRDFWDQISAEGLFDGVAFQLADFAYNSGPQTAIRAYQRILGVAEDGHFGPVSMQKSLTMAEPDQIMLVLAERLDFMTKLNNWPDASRGWARRIAANLRYGAEDS